VSYTDPATLKPHARSIGVVRRLRALARHGHDPADVATDYGFDRHHARTITIYGYPERASTVHADTDLWYAVAVAFGDLETTFGQSTWWRDYSAAQRWAVPFAWDDDTIDVPKRQANHGNCTGLREAVDPAAVIRRLDGDHTVELRRPDVEAAVARLHARGHSDLFIADALGVFSKLVFRTRVRLGLPANESERGVFVGKVSRNRALDFAGSRGRAA
jgi:hypothetical protein